MGEAGEGQSFSAQNLDTIYVAADLPTIYIVLIDRLFIRLCAYLSLKGGCI